jgi:periplasmic protein TonB
MFEDSLFASRVGRVSATRRWTLMASIGLQSVAVAGLMVLPLLHPELLSTRLEPPKVLMPLMPKPPVPIVTERVRTDASSSVALPSPTEIATATSLFPGLHPVVGDPPMAGPIGIGMGMGMPDGLPSGIGELGGGHGPAVTVRPGPGPSGPLHVSTGVSEGMLLAPIRPVYPAIARAAGVHGTVVVEAVISREGKIESLRVVSGPAMLQGAAIDAIREARYRPYRLNGQPTEVQTTITVNFVMGG